MPSNYLPGGQWWQNPSKIDRLSSLPDHLLHHIFKFLLFDEIIPTTLLSKRFHDLWTTSPTLRFSYYNQVNLEADVNRALLLYNSTTLQNLEICCKLSDAACASIIHWIRFAVSRNIQHLELSLICTEPYRPTLPSEPYRPTLPSSLCNCLSLQSLILGDFNLNRSSIHLPCLKILNVGRCTLSNIQLLIDACPRMEELRVFCCELDDFKIDARNHNYLRKISLSHFYYGRSIEVKNGVEVLAPKLVSLTLYGILCHRYIIAKLPSLSVARLSLAGRIPWHDSYLENFDFGQLMKMIVAVAHAQTLELCDWSILAVVKRNIKQEATILLSATRLELCSGLSEWALSGISFLFRGLHHLRDLKIYISEDIDSMITGNVSRSNIDAHGLFEYEYCKPLDDILSRGLCQLKTIRFRNFMKKEIPFVWNKGENEVNECLDRVKEAWVLKCFLKNVASLVKVVIELSHYYVKEDERFRLIPAVSRILLRLPRASPNVKFVFI